MKKKASNLQNRDPLDTNLTLKDPDEMLKLVFDSSPEAIIFLDTKGTILNINRKIHDWLGYMPQEVIGKNIIQLPFISKKSKAKIMQKFIKRVLSIDVPPYDIEFSKKNKEKVIGRLLATPIKNRNGKIIGDLVMISDITERKEKEDYILKEKKFAETIVQTSPVFFEAIGTDGKTIMMNDSYLNATGYTLDEVKGHDYLSAFIPKSEHKQLSQAFSTIAKHQKPQQSENHIQTKDERELLIEWNRRLVTDKQGKPECFFSIGVDITERRQTENTLKLLHTINTSINTGTTLNDILQKTADGIRDIFNDTACSILLADKSKNELTYYAFSTYPKIRKKAEKLAKTEIIGLKIPLSKESIFTEIIANKKTITTEDMTKAFEGFTGSETLKHFAREVTENHAFRTAILVPLTAKDEVIGITCAVSKKSITKKEAEALTQFASQLATAIKKAQAEQQLKQRLEFEKLITSISTHFINLAPKDVDAGINNTLKKIGRFAKVDRSYIVLFSENKERMYNTQEWCEKGIEPQIKNMKNIPTNSLPWWTGKLKKHETIHIPYISNLPKEAGAEKKILEAQGIRSVIVVPLIYKNSTIGFLGFDSVCEEKTWTEESIALLKIVGEAITNALMHRQAEKALKESEEKYRNIIETVNEQIWEVDANSIYTYISPMTRRVYGLEPEEIIGKTPFDFMPEEEAKRVAKIFKKIFISKKPFLNLENIVQNKDGRQITMESSGVPFFSHDNKLLGYRGTSRDITKRKKAHEELRQAKEWAELITTVAPSAIFTVDKNQKITSWNPRAAELTGYTAKESIGKKCTAFALEPCCNICGLYADDVKKPVIAKECTIRTKDNKILTISKNIDLLKDKNGNITGGIESFYDITEQKNFEKEREQYTAQLEQKTRDLRKANAKLKQAQNKISEHIDMLEHFKDATVDEILDMKEVEEENMRLKKELETLKTNQKTR
ncbi:MAG: hypothetical protein DRN71_03165 [Candidatus Nanohalarchaeota archaeon]|nr:MAG: hypothetical protein DRN71_03165 [Candidatus Nanohaloarchaeota archaeon]